MARVRLVAGRPDPPGNVVHVGVERRRFARTGVVVASVLAPFVSVLLVVLSQGRWFPAGDMAQAELHMRGFFADPPLVGAAGRILTESGFQGSHPGPSLWVAMLPMYLLGGRSSAALMVAVVSVHVVSAVAAIYLARRRYGWSVAVLVAFVIVFFVRSAGPDLVVEPWNPWLALMPFLVFVLLVDEIVRRPVSWRWIVSVVLVGSHCVQCHAGYALIVGVGLLVVAIVLIRRRSFSTIGAGSVALAVAWAAPLVDQWRREPGNISILVDHFGSPGEPGIAVVDALRIVATQFNVIGPWLLGPGPSRPAETWARWPGFVALVALAVIAHRRATKTGDRELAGLLATVAGGAAIAVLSILRLFGPYFEYTIRWTWILAALLTFGSGLALVRSARPGTSSRAPALPFWLGGLVAAAVVASVSAGVDAKIPGAIDSRIVGDLVPQLESHVDDDTVLLRFWDPYTLDATGFGTMLELERRGHDVRVDPSFAAAALPHRTATADLVDQVWWIVVGPMNDRLAREPDVERLGYVNPRSTDEQREAERLLADIEAGLIAIDRSELVDQLSAPGASLLFAEPPLEPEVAAMIRDLYRLGQPVGVYVLPEGLDVESLR
ncbi:MAG: hypothetical protein RIS41_2118 [Actinomycetota bacterium]